MAIDLCRDGIFADFQTAMDTATLPLWEKVTASWKRSPPMHVLLAGFVGYKPKAEPADDALSDEAVSAMLDWSAIDTPLSPEVVGAIQRTGAGTPF